jgi:hypothetical protein
MNKDSLLRAVVCQLRVASAAAIAVFVAACGGTAIGSSSPPDGGASDSGAQVGCPSLSDIDDGAALGNACASNGLYCTNDACDACTDACPAVACTDGKWARAVNTAICSADAGVTPTPDASIDTGTCTMLDAVGYDETCAADDDCVAVQAGEYCSNGQSCICPAASINVSGEASYDAMVQEALTSVQTSGESGCSCPFFGAAKCVAGMCTLCGGASGSVGCPDGG